MLRNAVLVLFLHLTLLIGAGADAAQPLQPGPPQEEVVQPQGRQPASPEMRDVQIRQQDTRPPQESPPARRLPPLTREQPPPPGGEMVPLKPIDPDAGRRDHDARGFGGTPPPNDAPQETITNLVIERLALRPQQVTQGKTVQFLVHVRNHGPSHAVNASVEFNVETEMIGKVPVRNLGSNEAADVTIDFVAPASGDFAVFAHLLPGPETEDPNMEDNHVGAVLKVVPPNGRKLTKADPHDQIRMPSKGSVPKDGVPKGGELSAIPQIPSPGSQPSMMHAAGGFIVSLPDKNTTWSTWAKAGIRQIDWTVDSTVTQKQINGMNKKINITLQAEQGSGAIFYLAQNLPNHIAKPYLQPKDTFQWGETPKAENLPNGKYTVQVSTSDSKYTGISAPFSIYTPPTIKALPPKTVLGDQEIDKSKAGQVGKKGEPPPGQKAPTITSFKYLYFKPIISGDWLTGVDIGIQLTVDREFKFGSLSDAKAGWAYIEPKVDLYTHFAYAPDDFDNEWLLGNYYPGGPHLQYPTKVMPKGQSTVVLKIRNLQFPFHGVHTIGMQKIYIKGAKQAGKHCEQWKYPRLKVYPILKSLNSFKQASKDATFKNVVMKDNKVTSGYISGKCQSGPW